MLSKIKTRLYLALILPVVIFAQFPETVHPGYSLVNLRPATFQPRGIGGMDFLADGTLAICTWGGYRTATGEVYLVSGVDGTGPASVQVRKIAQGLVEPMGLKVVSGEIYVMQQTELSKIVVPAGTAMAIPTKVVGGWAPPVGDWTYGLVYKDGSFYGTQGGWGSGPPLTKDQNSWLKLTPGVGYQVLAGGLRNADGIDLGPDGEMFATDNQGNWLPSSKLIHLRIGKFYGHRYNTLNLFANGAESPPAVWVPHGSIGYSPTHPILVPGGVYQGQMLAGDVHFGGMARYFLEKVKDSSGIPQYQGAVFRFTGGLECGVHRLLIDKTGAIYMGGIGGVTLNTVNFGSIGGGTWNWNNTWTGLQKLVPKGNTAFDMLAVRSLADGFELEFTHPTTGGGLPTKYFAEQWRYVPTAEYGGPQVDKANLAVVSATVSVDGKKIQLKIPGLKTGFVVHIKVTGLLSTTGEDLWAKDTWYTLNNRGPGEPPTAIKNRSADQAASSPVLHRVLTTGAGKVQFEITFNGSFSMSLFNSLGQPMGNVSGSKPGLYSWLNSSGKSGLYHYQIHYDNGSMQSGHFLIN